MPEVLERVEEKSAVEATLPTVAVVGLGYVGLPVAVEFGKRRPTIGYDLSKKRIENLRHFVDATGEVATADLMAAKQLRPSAYPAELEQADFIIIAVPTPINAARQPDLTPLEMASETVGRYMKQGATVIYESTVYPGATEEVCVPILEKH
jgi:UDP-N-acetyl-D-galactosamine dehydrogenase